MPGAALWGTDDAGEGRLVAAFWEDIDGDLEGLFSGADGDAAEGADVGEVATPGDGDVAVAGEDVVGGVGVDPAELFAAEDGDPRVGGIGADEAFLAWRGSGFEVTADVAGGEAEGAQAGDHDLGEVLADAAALFEDFGDGGGDVGGFGIEEKVLIDAAVEVGDAVEDGASGGEGGAGVVSEGGSGGDEGGGVGEFGGGVNALFERGGAGVAQAFPGGGSKGVDGIGIVDFDEAAGDDLQLGVGAGDFEIEGGVAEVVHARGTFDGFGPDVDFMPWALLAGEGSGGQTCQVVADGYRALVGVGGAMDDAVAHGRMGWCVGAPV